VGARCVPGRPLREAYFFGMTIEALLQLLHGCRHFVDQSVELQCDLVVDLVEAWSLGVIHCEAFVETLSHDLLEGVGGIGRRPVFPLPLEMSGDRIACVALKQLDSCTLQLLVSSCAVIALCGCCGSFHEGVIPPCSLSVCKYCRYIIPNLW